MGKTSKTSGKGSKAINGKGSNFKKTECKFKSRQDFRDVAEDLDFQIDGHKGVVSPKEFSTGTLGFYVSEKGFIESDGERHRCQITVSVYIIGSKELPKDDDDDNDSQDDE